MRRKSVISAAAVVGGSLCMILSCTTASAQVSNPMWNLPNSNSNPPDGGSGTDYLAEFVAGGPAWSATVEGNQTQMVAAQTSASYQASATTPGSGWYMSPAANPDFGYTNAGQRDQFYSVEPIVNPGPPASGWSFWLQTFTQSGDAQQTVTSTDNSVAVAGGKSYTFSSQMSFQDGSGPGMGFNATTLANQTEASPAAPNTGDLSAYLEIVFLNNHGIAIGSDTTNIAAGTVSIYNQSNGTTNWAPYSVSGVAPAGALSAELLIGWTNGGLDGGTGGQSAFADDATFTSPVPEPATLSVLALGSAGLFMRRRNKVVA